MREETRYLRPNSTTAFNAGVLLFPVDDLRVKFTSSVKLKVGSIHFLNFKGQPNTNYRIKGAGLHLGDIWDAIEVFRWTNIRLKIFTSNFTL
jgi:hypothetical protein